MSKWGSATPKERESAPASVFCGPNRSYPIADQEDFDNAVHALGRAKGDTGKIKACMIRKAKAAGWTLPDAWQSASKDGSVDRLHVDVDGVTRQTVNRDATLIRFGGAVKAMGAGKIGGYLITFGDETTPDLSHERDYFTPATDFDIEDGDTRSVYYAHGLDAKMGVKKIGRLTVKTDDVGVWVEAQLKLRDEYEQAVYDMAAKGKLGWSSGAPAHLVTRKSVETKAGGTVHEILTWPIAEGSLTPTPAESRATNSAIALKSLPALLGMTRDAEDHTTKALPAGMSYTDLLTFLTDELNEDLGDADDPGAPWAGAMMGMPLCICDLYDDVVIYRDDEDLFRIPYTVTAGNDAVWGTPEAVVRTTVYQPATDADAAEDMPMKADVTVLKAMLRGSMTLDDHVAVVLDAIAGFVTRAEGLSDLAIKAGRPMSAARHAKLKAAYGGMRTAHTAMDAHLQAINDMLLSTDPNPTKDVEDFAALRTRFVRLQSELLHLTGSHANHQNEEEHTRGYDTGGTDDADQ